ncbi:MAG: hypothetical protein ACK5OB_17295 [Pirellula sp.]
MNNRSLVRKIVYILAIVGLLLPLYFLGRPATKGSGKISELRSRYRIGQADLGKLDPTSESMKLATLGMRGIASTILWLRADYYKEEKYFDRFSATLNQIALLQPHFISVWQHQAHNLSYNVSPEFEDYRQRYEWVKKGIDYLVKGTKFNTRKPILQYELGHYVGNKLGKADEKAQYRDLFRNDNDFHQYFVEKGLNAVSDDAMGPDRKPDNWLVGKLWFEAAYQLVAAGNPIKKSAHLLYSYAPLWQMYHGEAIEDEGVLDERARFVWERAGREWKEFGNRELGGTNASAVTLRSLEFAKEEVFTLRRQFGELTASVRDQVMEEKKKNVPPTKLASYDKPDAERNVQDRMYAAEVATAIEPTYQELAARLPRAQQIRALELANDLAAAEARAKDTNSLRDQVNYAYWEVRAQAEQQSMMVEARRLLFEANKLIDVADIKGATEKYEAAFVRWDKVFRYYPVVMTEDVGEEVLKSINRYKKLIDEELDERFVLFEFMQFRRAYDADYLDFNVEKTLSDWRSRIEEFGSPEDFFNTPLAEAYGIQGDAQKQPAAPKQPADAGSDKEPSDQPATSNPAPQPQPTKASDVDAPSASSPTRPPRLENPE